MVFVIFHVDHSQQGAYYLSIYSKWYSIVQMETNDYCYDSF